MKMKDKLYRNNHKGIYYKARRLGVTSMVVFSGMAAIGFTTYINVMKSTEAIVETPLKRDACEVVETPVKERIDTKKIQTFVDRI